MRAFPSFTASPVTRPQLVDGLRCERRPRTSLPAMKNSPATKRLVGFAGRQVRTPEDSPAADDDDDDNFDSSPELSLSKRSSAELLDPSSPSTELPPAAPLPAAELDPPRASTTLPSPVAPPPIAALAVDGSRAALPSVVVTTYSRLAGDGKQSLSLYRRAGALRRRGAAAAPTRASDHAEDIGVLPGLQDSPPRAVAVPGGARPSTAGQQASSTRSRGQRDAAVATRALRRTTRR